MEKAQIIIHAVLGLTAARSCRAAVFHARRRLFLPVTQCQDLCQAHRAQGDPVALNRERLHLSSIVEA